MFTNTPFTEPKTRAEAAGIAIAKAIISGEFAPGSRLAIRDLSKKLGIGPSPLREALARLAGRGLVIAYGQQGFRVAPVSKSDLYDLMRTRTVLETGALRLSIELGDSDWEAGIISTLHKMKHFQANLPEALDDRSRQFEALNMAFHRALISACGSPRLIALHDELYEQTRRYRSLMLNSRDVGRGLYDAHLGLANTVLARETEKACKELVEHNNVVLRLVFDASESTEIGAE